MWRRYSEIKTKHTDYPSTYHMLKQMSIIDMNIIVRRACDPFDDASVLSTHVQMRIHWVTLPITDRHSVSIAYGINVNQFFFFFTFYTS